MTEKHAVANILTALDNSTIRKLFISEWLEDINWHSENGRFNSAVWTEVDDMTVKRIENAIKTKAEHPEALQTVSESLMYEYNLYRQLMRGLVYIFGWGTCPTDWKSAGTGQLFVDELIRMLDLKSSDDWDV